MINTVLIAPARFQTELKQEPERKKWPPERMGSSETSVTSYKTTRRYNIVIFAAI
jgi:hypothetical protein